MADPYMFRSRLYYGIDYGSTADSTWISATYTEPPSSPPPMPKFKPGDIFQYNGSVHSSEGWCFERFEQFVVRYVSRKGYIVDCIECSGTKENGLMISHSQADNNSAFVRHDPAFNFISYFPNLSHV